MTIREMKNDETFTASTTVNGKTVDATWSVRANENGPRYAVTSKFDFSGCSQAEILELAMRSVVIDVQRQWRILAASKGSTARTVNPFKAVNVKTAIVDAPRKSAPANVKAANLFAKMSAAEQKAFLASIGAAAPAKKTA